MLTADYVSTEDGTGVVHIAPAFGEEDKAVTDAAGIEVVNPVDAQGRFTNAVAPYEGYQVFDANMMAADPKRPGCSSGETATSIRTRNAGAATPR